MLTNRTKYALKALLYLARHRGEGRARAADISPAEQIPPKFLEQILHELRNKGMVRSQVGKGGGHELARDPEDIDLLSVIRAIEGPIAPLPCLSQTAYARCDDCPDENRCGARRLMSQAYEASLTALAGTALADALSMTGDAKPGKRAKR